jgi:hypothetical protein
MRELYSPSLANISASANIRDFKAAPELLNARNLRLSSFAQALPLSQWLKGLAQNTNFDQMRISDGLSLADSNNVEKSLGSSYFRALWPFVQVHGQIAPAPNML